MELYIILYVSCRYKYIFLQCQKAKSISTSSLWTVDISLKKVFQEILNIKRLKTKKTVAKEREKSSPIRPIDSKGRVTECSIISPGHVSFLPELQSKLTV